MENTILRIDAIRTDGGTQPRALIDFDAVNDYMDAMADGVEFPPVVVFYDGTEYWLADGFHRLKAAYGADRETIACIVHQGTREDAQWYSFGANKANGLRRTSQDITRAVESALRHSKAAKLSDRKIAKHVGCGHSWVSEIRNRVCPERKDKRRTVTRNGKTYEMDTAKIGGKGRRKGEPSAPLTSGLESAPSQANPAPDVISDWIVRIGHACADMADCPFTAQDLAKNIRHRSTDNQLTKHLEKTREFITAVLAEAGID
jgi:hypothetical protein